MRLCLAVFAWAMGSCVLEAADPPRAVTNPRDADADYAIQGEYYGCAVWQGCSRPCGLQLAAQGGGAFRGNFYPGGLPGWGYYGSEKVAVQGGRLSSDPAAAIELTGDGLRVSIPAAGRAELYDFEGAKLGELVLVTRQSPTMGAAPPRGATVLFNGTDTGALSNLKISPEGWMEVGAETKGAWQDFWMHAEFKTPYMPAFSDQKRGNSGFYLHRRYEVQVLDSFALDPVFNGSAALYRFKAPDFNMALPPLTWQTYDIQFTAPRFAEDGTTRLSKGRITVWHNGVVVQNNVELENKTGGGKAEGPDALPILFQNHSDPVQFRNIWLVDQTPATSAVASTMLAGWQQPMSRREWRRWKRGRN